MLQILSTICGKLIWETVRETKYNLRETYLRDCPGNKVQFAGNLSERLSGKQSSLNLSLFLFFFFLFFFFLFYQKVSKFIKFRVFFKVLFRRILGWIFFLLNFLYRTSEVDFHLFLLLFLGKLHSRSKERNQSVSLKFFVLSVRVPKFVLSVRLVVLARRRKSLFGAVLSGITSPFSTPAKIKCRTWPAKFFS